MIKVCLIYLYITLCIAGVIWIAKETSDKEDYYDIVANLLFWPLLLPFLGTCMLLKAWFVMFMIYWKGKNE